MENHYKKDSIKIAEKQQGEKKIAKPALADSGREAHANCRK